MIPGQNGNHIEVRLIPNFHPTNIQPMWHGYLQLVLQLKSVVAYDNVAWSFVIGFTTKKCIQMRCFTIG